MINSYFIGRIGKDGARVIQGQHGDFLTMDVATDIYSKGENKPMWIRVRSNQKGHTGKFADYLTRGKAVEIAGYQIEPEVWIGKDGQPHAQTVVLASMIKFVPFGKKQEDENLQKTPTTSEPAAAPAPGDKEDDLPF